jgi:hypothetical protein
MVIAIHMKFLTAKQLNIDPDVRRALIALKRKLRAFPNPDNTDSYVSIYGMYRDNKVKRAPVKFNMSAAVASYDCGTAFCIGGFIQLEIMGKLKSAVKPIRLSAKQADSIDDFVNSKLTGFSILQYLFYPTIPEDDWDKIETEDAVKAIDNYLTTGDPRWEEVMR